MTAPFSSLQALSCLQWDIARRENLVCIHDRAIGLHRDRLAKHESDRASELQEIERLKSAILLSNSSGPWERSMLASTQPTHKGSAR